MSLRDCPHCKCHRALTPGEWDRCPCGYEGCGACVIEHQHLKCEHQDEEQGAYRRAPHKGTVLGRANELLDAWLRGMNEAGNEATPEDIKAVFLASLARAKAEAKP